MKLEPVFCSFISSENLSLDNDKLELYCRDKVLHDIKNITLQQGQTSLLDPDSQPELKELIDIINNRIKDICNVIGLKQDLNVEVNQLWINIDTSPLTIQPHNHTSMFSCVYYVSGGEDCGNINFTTPITSLPYVFPVSKFDKFTAFSAYELSITPVTGQLIIFPGWLTHYVVPKKETGKRISIAFDANIITMPL